MRDVYWARTSDVGWGGGILLCADHVAGLHHGVVVEGKPIRHTGCWVLFGAWSVRARKSDVLHPPHPYLLKKYHEGTAEKNMIWASVWNIEFPAASAAIHPLITG